VRSRTGSGSGGRVPSGRTDAVAAPHHRLDPRRRGAEPLAQPRDRHLDEMLIRLVATPDPSQQLAFRTHDARPGQQHVEQRPLPLGQSSGSGTVDDEEAPLDAHRRAAEAGRLSCFTPASGAASRMFKSLLAVRQETGDTTRSEVEQRAAAGDKDAREVLALP